MLDGVYKGKLAGSGMVVWEARKLLAKGEINYDEFMEEKSEYRDILRDIGCYLGGDEMDDSHKWVEQMMIYYNKEMGKILKERNMGILRRHSEPNREKLERYRGVVSEWMNLAYSSAEYCLGDEKETGHYGLETDHYAHCTSPIRRYADLINQRIIKRILTSNKEEYIVPQAMYDMNMIEKRVRKFSKNMEFLDAIMGNDRRFEGIIVEKKREEEMVKIKIYILKWKRVISTRYKYVSDDKVLSRDEKEEIEVKDFKEVIIECMMDPNKRNWKDRVVIHLSNKK